MSCEELSWWFLSWFCAESKVFELLVVEGASGLHFVQGSRGIVRVVFVGKLNVVWLLSVVEKLVKGEVTTKFSKSLRNRKIHHYSREV